MSIYLDEALRMFEASQKKHSCYQHSEYKKGCIDCRDANKEQRDNPNEVHESDMEDR